MSGISGKDTIRQMLMSGTRSGHSPKAILWLGSPAARRLHGCRGLWQYRLRACATSASCRGPPEGHDQGALSWRLAACCADCVAVRCHKQRMPLQGPAHPRDAVTCTNASLDICGRARRSNFRARDLHYARPFQDQARPSQPKAKMNIVQMLPISETDVAATTASDARVASGCMLRDRPRALCTCVYSSSTARPDLRHSKRSPKHVRTKRPLPFLVLRTCVRSVRPCLPLRSASHRGRAPQRHLENCCAPLRHSSHFATSISFL